MKQANLLALFCIYFFVSGCKKTDFVQALNTTGNPLFSQAAMPNIILILSDDLGYEIPTYTGGQSYSTPNIDNMANRGIKFTQAYTAPLCSPSRCMLLTAKYNFRNYTTWGVLDTSQKTIANLLKSNGYATCAAGKWQFDGGDASIRAFGFDNYLVTNPFKIDTVDEGQLYFYKNPQLYENGNFWPDSSVNGKYGEDLERDYIFSFIDSVRDKKPFFIYWAPNLVHDPYCPTPDDPQFASWDVMRPAKPRDTVYFPSMVRYHDKVIGELLAKLQSSNIAGKTLVLWLGDNGTSKDIHSKWNGQVVQGGKAKTTSDGTHVPMVAYMPGKIIPGTDSNMVSLVDFMSTIGDAAGVTIPAAYGTTDGISFYNRLFGNNTKARSWVFCHFTGSGRVETEPLALRRWMQNKTYKQYDSLPNILSGRFFNIVTDPDEKFPIEKANMTAEEKKISNQFLKYMGQLH